MVCVDKKYLSLTGCVMDWIHIFVGCFFYKPASCFTLCTLTPHFVVILSESLCQWLDNRFRFHRPRKFIEVDCEWGNDPKVW